MQLPERARGNLDTMETLEDNCSDWLESCLSVDAKSDVEDATKYPETSSYGDRSSEERKGTYARLRSSSKSHSTPLTLKWLDENYEIAEGVCIPRSTLYVHYLDYCEKNDTQPVNAASFGKIIRQQFPQLTTRRLGTRGQSKYHYYGIGVKDTSLYFEELFSAKGIQSTLDGKKDTSKQIIAYSPRSKLGTLLPEFPDIKDLKLPATVDEGKVLTFLMMYRTHCQRILDTVIRANFDEVQSFLLHFWQGMPNHIKSILECKILVTLVGVCDSILYRAIANVLMPTVLQPLPESLTQVIRKFSVQLDTWLRQALFSLPHNLQKIKFDLLKRQTSLNHLCQAARTVIHSSDITSQMLDDWINVDLNSIIKQTLYTMDNYCDIDHNVIVKLTRDFELLLEDQAPLESYIEWLDGMVDQCVIQRSCKQVGMLQKTARQFLLMWSCFGTRVIRDMTLHSAPSFGSFHLLHLMFDEYVLYMVENLYNQDRANELIRAVKGEQSTDFLDDLILVDVQSSSNVSPIASPGVDRTSVIRGPECNVHISGQPDVLPPYVATPNTETSSCLQQSLVYNDQRNSSNGVASQFSTYPTFGTSFSPQAVARPKHMTAYHSSHGHFGSQLPEVMNSNNNSTNTYDWYDWSTVGQMATSAAPNMTFNKTPDVDQRVSFKPTYPHYNEYGASENQNYDTYFGNVNFKRNSFDGHRMKRKVDDDTSGLTNKQSMVDTYQYHVTNLV